MCLNSTVHQLRVITVELLKFFDGQSQTFTSLVRAATYKAVSGVSSAGFKTTVQPAANAADHFHDKSTNGKFHYDRTINSSEPKFLNHGV